MSSLNPSFNKGPYTWEIKNLGFAGFEAEIYFNGEFVTKERYFREYSYGFTYTGSDEGVEATEEEAVELDLQYKAQRRGFFNKDTQKSYPALTDLNITNKLVFDLPPPGDSEIDTSEVINLVGITPTPSPSQNGEVVNIPERPKKLQLKVVTGTVVDSITNEPIKGAKVSNALKKSSRTNNKGEFKIKVPNILNTDFDPKKFELNILKKKYSSIKITPYTSTNDVKSNLGIITLQPLESNVKQEVTELTSLKDSQVKEYSTNDVTFEFSQQKQLNKSTNELKKLVIPLILGMVAQYGLSKVQELLVEVEGNGGQLTENIKQQIVCPPKEDLLKIINLKNKLVNQLNKTLNTINKTTKTIEVTDTTIQTIDTVFQVLKFLPTPTAIAGVGIPISVVNAVQDTKTFLSGNIGKLKKGSSSLSNILGLLVDTLTQVLSFLKFLDLITQFCSQGEDIDQAQISKELTAVTQRQSNQLNPVVTNVNGFKMGVETEITDQPLKRRRAIAQNKKGIVMLKGEWSFSSIDQILIDELVFYIQINNLKAD